ncbi:hypothetical protein HJG60_008077 [Phyllostomus discolor]|uniref:Uncharacterized protein n=1 Tax=Phyllostomus discolor TaxID=89673 RepID=A0A834BJ16_9CHIR|nr:hypothetical protein HJG60_008077 [Phyllostomus discolor]
MVLTFSFFMPSSVAVCGPACLPWCVSEPHEVRPASLDTGGLCLPHHHPGACREHSAPPVNPETGQGHCRSAPAEPHEGLARAAVAVCPARSRASSDESGALHLRSSPPGGACWATGVAALWLPHTQT